MNRLSRNKRIQIISCLTEGMTINGVTRVVGVLKNAVLRLLCQAGDACAEYQDVALRNLPCKRLQIDECWAFCRMKERNVPDQRKGQLGWGNVWTWSAIDADSKVIVRAMLGSRDAGTAHEFLMDVSKRLIDRIQLTTDGLSFYLDAVADAFSGPGVDFAMLIKVYGHDPQEEHRYSPPVCVGCRGTAISGRPEREHVSTSFIERSHLTLRMTQKRWARLTTAFSRKLQNMEAALNLHTMVYNFVKVHTSLGTTPAIKLGVAARRWTMEDIIGLVEEHEASQAEK